MESKPSDKTSEDAPSVEPAPPESGERKAAPRGLVAPVFQNPPTRLRRREVRRLAIAHLLVLILNWFLVAEGLLLTGIGFIRVTIRSNAMVSDVLVLILIVCVPIFLFFLAAQIAHQKLWAMIATLVVVALVGVALGWLALNFAAASSAIGIWPLVSVLPPLALMIAVVVATGLCISPLLRVTRGQQRAFAVEPT